MERASAARDGDSRTAMDGAKWPLEWELQARAEQLQWKKLMDKLHLLIVDQHPIVEDSLELLLQDYTDIEISATASNCEEGLLLLKRLAPDVVIMDLRFEEMDGVEAIPLYLEEQPELAIVVFSELDEEVYVYRALKAGARGYILKSSPLNDLVNAVRAVADGGYQLSSSLSPQIIEFYLQHRDEQTDQLGEYQHLSEREKQVFRLLAIGHQTQEIAELLCISPKTVAKHRVSIKNKLTLKNTAEMAQYAIQLGLIPVAEA
jgi:two-component system response regulator NreC